jgi:hypothetical protein
MTNKEVKTLSVGHPLTFAETGATVYYRAPWYLCPDVCLFVVADHAGGTILVDAGDLSLIEDPNE